MAEVWSGAHLLQDVPVAVKVITRADVQSDALRAAVRNEVRAMAGLDHPGILMLFDCGEVTAAEQQASAGALRQNSPYLIMERADGGTAASLAGRLGFVEARRLLLAVLGALAHAHSRGVIHRDVKPSNVLRCGDRFKLSDFGVALRLEPEDSAVRRAARVQGTPAYMAPEQFVGRWQDYGPATDLYSVGCVAYALLGGQPPFGRSRHFETMYTLHAEALPSPLTTEQAVPDGVDRWLRRLLQKQPSRRFQRAVDAARALLALGDPPAPPAEANQPSPEAQATPKMITLDAPTVQSGTAVRKRAASTTAHWDDEAEVLGDPLPEITSSWQTGPEEGRAMSLLGAGLGLHGLRATPMVGRHEERAHLWEALRRAWSAARPQLVLLEGAAGCGKTRLAQWLCERAHESVSVEVLRATHSPLAGPGHGLGAMLARHLRSAGMTRRELTCHVEELLARDGLVDRHERDAVVELASPIAQAAAAAQPSALFASASERHAVLGRWIRRLGRRRPVVLWLDDVPWGLDAIAFAEHLLTRARGDTPALVVMTARTEAIAEQPEAARLLRQCLDRVAGERLMIGPVEDDRWPELLERLLHFEPALARRVAEHTGGNPLFAVQLADDWVDRGLIEAGPRGFRLREGVPVELPASLAALWRNRLRHLLHERPAADAAALELAAALGLKVDRQEWLDASAAAEHPAPSEGLVEELLVRRLAVTGERGPEQSFAFAHGMLRECLEEQSRAAGRWREHHAACARMLRTRRGPGVAERLGRHWVRGGELEQAFAPLRQGARERLHRGDYAQAEALAGELEQALAAASRPDGDARWAHAWLLRSRVAILQGRHDDGLRWARQTEERAREHGWLRALAEALILQGTIYRTKGNTSRALELVELGRDLALELDDERRLAEALDALGRLLLHRGELERAERCWHEARELYQSSGDAKGAACVLWSLAHVSSYQQRFGLAERYNRGALEELERLGDRWSVARCLNTAGELSRYRGELDAAEQHYRRAGRIMNSLGAEDSAAICDTNVARLLIERRRFDEAREALERGAAILEDHGRLDALAWIHTALLSCCVAAADWEGFALHFDNARLLLDESRYLDLDIAEVARLAGDLAADAARAVEARQAYGLSERQWAALGRTEEAEEVRRRLRCLADEGSLR